MHNIRSPLPTVFLQYINVHFENLILNSFWTVTYLSESVTKDILEPSK